MELTEKERHVIVHALTGSSSDGKVYRNYYAASPGHHSMPTIETLIEKGMMRAGRPNGEGRYYHVTLYGAACVGLPLKDAEARG